MSKNCGECVYWAKRLGGNGATSSCERNPPVLAGTVYTPKESHMYNTPRDGVWPETRKTDSCGEFKQRGRG